MGNSVGTSLDHHRALPTTNTGEEAPPPPARAKQTGGEMKRRHEARGAASNATPTLPLILIAICLQFATGVAGDPQMSKDDKKPGSQSKDNSNQTVLFVLLGVGVVILLSFFLFKFWQKKKREEQHARLLKLFEEDDELELELGLRD